MTLPTKLDFTNEIRKPKEAEMTGNHAETKIKH